MASSFASQDPQSSVFLLDPQSGFIDAATRSKHGGHGALLLPSVLLLLALSGGPQGSPWSLVSWPVDSADGEGFVVESLQ